MTYEIKVKNQSEDYIFSAIYMTERAVEENFGNIKKLLSFGSFGELMTVELYQKKTVRSESKKLTEYVIPASNPQGFQDKKKVLKTADDILDKVYSVGYLAGIQEAFDKPEQAKRRFAEINKEIAGNGKTDG